MGTKSTSDRPEGSRWIPLTLALAAAAAYANTFRVPFLLDDHVAIVGNESLRQAAGWADRLMPRAFTTSGRPLLNLSFVANHAWSGTGTWSYHVINLLIHILAGLALFGIVRRTLLLRDRPRFETSATPLAGVIAATWVLHPLQTQAVTYISQRAESLMGLFYLLSLYCFIRAARSPEQPWWGRRSIAACFLGMATKETMVTAPLLILLYDRSFISASFREALRNRRGIYAGLAASWVLLIALMWLLRRDSSVGFERGVSAWTYAMTESRVILAYLKLALWPHPLVFDYGPEILLTNLLPALPHGLIVLAGVAAAAMAWRKCQPIGFMSLAFFVLLAPTSSLVPITMQPMAESRMYLPSAAIIALAALGAFVCSRRVAIPLVAAAAMALGVQTWARNGVYRTPIGLWEDTARQRPQSARVQNNLGDVLLDAGRTDEAIPRLQAALRIDPSYAEAHFNLGRALAKVTGREGEAVARFEQALRLRPEYPEAHANLAMVMMRIGRSADAIRYFQSALRSNPNPAEVHHNLATLLELDTARQVEAIRHYRAAVRIKPDLAEAQNNLALALIRNGDASGALPHLETAAALNPAYRGNLDRLKEELRARR